VGVRIRDLVLGIQQTYRLRDEKRIPFRFGVDRLDEPTRRLNPGGQLDVFRHVILAQAPERDLGCTPLSHELGQRRDQWISHGRVDVPERTDQEQASVRDFTGHEPE
jgi:hypothetical protein